MQGAVGRSGDQRRKNAPIQKKPGAHIELSGLRSDRQVLGQARARFVRLSLSEKPGPCAESTGKARRKSVQPRFFLLQGYLLRAFPAAIPADSRQVFQDHPICTAPCHARCGQVQGKSVCPAFPLARSSSKRFSRTTVLVCRNDRSTLYLPQALPSRVVADRMAVCGDIVVNGAISFYFTNIRDGYVRATKQIILAKNLLARSAQVPPQCPCCSVGFSNAPPRGATSSRCGAPPRAAAFS